MQALKVIEFRLYFPITASFNVPQCFEPDLHVLYQTQVKGIEFRVKTKGGGEREREREIVWRSIHTNLSISILLCSSQSELNEAQCEQRIGNLDFPA